MKIGIFTDTYTPQINGVVTVVKLMARELTKLGHQVFIFGPSHPDQGSEKEKEGQVYRFPSFKFIFQGEYRVVIPYQRQAFSVFSQLDIIHSHDPFSMGLLAMRASKKHDIPHIHHYHTLFTEYRHYLPKIIRPSRRMAERISAAFCNRCQAIITPSRQMKAKLEKYGVNKPIFTLPFGVDISEFEKEIKWNIREELHLADKEALLLHSGRLAKEKNLKFLLRAFKEMLKQRGQMRLVLTGGGPEREELENYAAELGIKDKVIFTGYVDWEKLIDLYKVADLFIFASKTETQGIVLVEAMAAGTPVVAISEMGVLEIVKDGETGILAKEDEEEFAKAVLELLEDRERLKVMGEKAKEYAYSMSAQNCSKELLEIYAQFLPRKRYEAARV